MSNTSQIFEFDEEIFDIFVEEAGEVIEELDSHLPTWQADRDNRAALTEIRRNFHTLKGSGRMVKAFTIAEIAWKVEQALNKALDGNLAITPALVDVVLSARKEIPALITALKNRQIVTIEGHLARLCDRIDQVGRGETLVEVPKANVVSVPVTPAVKAEDLEEIQVKIAELMKQVGAIAGKADEALGLSRKAVNQCETQDTKLQTYASQIELGKCRTQLQTLSTDLSDLRALVKSTSDQINSQKSNVKQELERKFAEERTSFALIKSELSNDIQRLQEQMSKSRQWALSVAGGMAGLAFLLSLAVIFGIK